MNYYYWLCDLFFLSLLNYKAFVGPLANVPHPFLFALYPTYRLMFPFSCVCLRTALELPVPLKGTGKARVDVFCLFVIIHLHLGGGGRDR